MSDPTGAYDEVLIAARRVLNDPSPVAPRRILPGQFMYESLPEWQARALFLAGLLSPNGDEAVPDA